jgi:hypothetical protein
VGDFFWTGYLEPLPLFDGFHKISMPAKAIRVSRYPTGKSPPRVSTRN